MDELLIAREARILIPFSQSAIDALRADDEVWPRLSGASDELLPGLVRFEAGAVHLGRHRFLCEADPDLLRGNVFSGRIFSHGGWSATFTLAVSLVEARDAAATALPPDVVEIGRDSVPQAIEGGAATAHAAHARTIDVVVQPPQHVEREWRARMAAIGSPAGISWVPAAPAPVTLAEPGVLRVGGHALRAPSHPDLPGEVYVLHVAVDRGGRHTARLLHVEPTAVPDRLLPDRYEHRLRVPQATLAPGLRDFLALRRLRAAVGLMAARAWL